MKRVIASLLVLLGIVSFINREVPLTEENIIQIEPLVVVVDRYHPSVVNFMDVIARIESGGRYEVTNRFGYMGRYQFSPRTVKYLGYDISRDEFLSDYALQDSIMYHYMYVNNKSLRSLIYEYDGVVIDGIRINRATILAGAHFAGASGMKRFLKSSGRTTTTDANGTTIKKYISNFSDMELPSLITS
jgi:hypothetical protein